MITIRDAEEDDLPAIVALLADDPLGATREAPGEPLDPSYVRAFTPLRAQAGNTVLVATGADGTIAGCLQLTMIPGLARKGMTRAQIEGVRVAAAMRGRKIGEALMDEALARARAHDCGLVQLTTDASRTDAHRFYERYGFVASHVGMKLALEP